MIVNVGFIGPGKVGCSLGRHITEKGGDGIKVSGYYGRDKASAEKAAALSGGRAYGSPEELAAACNLLLLTVPDKQIADVWVSFSGKLAERDKLLFVGHCSGSQSSEVFRPHPGCHFGSVHPILAVHDKESSYKNLDAAYFTVEGDEAFKDLASGLLTALGNPYCAIDADQKTKYHAASVMVSNLVCALAYEGMETFKACGLDEDFAESAWRSLFLGNAENTASVGPVRALTGPVERGDAATVARHLHTLSGDAREIYLLLSRKVTETAQHKNPDRDYSEMIKLLENS